MKQTKYYQLYDHFRSLIVGGELSEGDKLPSIRACASSFETSRTTVEAAYDMLAAEGYVISKPQSGFIVCHVGDANNLSVEYEREENVRFDLVSPSADRSAFNFSLWRRYVKSALRQDERLLSYGEPQGEYDLRQAVCEFVRTQRGVICSPDQIVIAAGTQSLIAILCGVLKDAHDVAFVCSGFIQGEAVFEDHGRSVSEIPSYDDGLRFIEQKRPALVYVSPSHIDRWGSVMTSAERRRLLECAKASGSCIIEDDYDSEFRYASKYISPLRAMNGGENVIYIGTVSRLLIPSIRISFMVLPHELTLRYKERSALYNQTASKAEQIALCRYIRDGHLSAQIRKQRNRYLFKRNEMLKACESLLCSCVCAEECAGSYLIRLRFTCGKTAAELCALAAERGLRMQNVDDCGKEAHVMISIAGVNAEEFEQVCGIINECCTL